MSKLSLKDKEKYYKKDKQGKLYSKVILKELKDKDEIVYGARSINAVLPSYLKKHTEDWDIYTDDDPKAVAIKIEKELDKRYGGNYFYVEPAKHEGTFRIKSKVTNKEVADITFKEDEVEHRVIGGVNYSTLDYQVCKIQDVLKDEESKFRHDKDKETLQRIEIHLDKYVPQSSHNKRTICNMAKNKKSIRLSKPGLSRMR